MRVAAMGLALIALAGCEEGQQPGFLQLKDKPAEAGTVPGQSTKLVERDVEDPDVFQVTEAGLWDGRPSLGGVWVAHPDVTDPQRVIIRNSANNKFVIGALFRREREIAGPRIQASSDAAAALGMLAGAPVQLNVTALIREAVNDPEPQPESTPKKEKKATPTVVADTSDDIAETSLDPIAGAAAAIDASEPVVAEKKPLFGFLKKKDPEVETTELTAAPLSAIPTEIPLAAAPTPAAAPKPKPKASSLTKPYIQIGIFSVEANANQTADQMRRAGMVPTVFSQSSKGKPFWRVVVGPAQNSSERNTLLNKVKKTGFSDAYFVTN